MYEHFEMLIDIAVSIDELWDIYNDVLVSFIEGELDVEEVVALELLLDESHERMWFA